MNPPARRWILIVDDDVHTTIVLSRLINARGFRTMTANSLEAAQQIAATGIIGFIICDLGLPDGDGCTLMADLSGESGITGVALSGFGMQADVKRSQEAGFALHLTKPIHVSHLDQILAVAARELDKLGPPAPP